MSPKSPTAKWRLESDNLGLATSDVGLATGNWQLATL